MEESQSTANDLSPCLFPPLTDGKIPDDSALLQAARDLIVLDLGLLHNAESLNRFCTEREVALPALFYGVWALMLSVYLDTNTVGFIVSTGERNVALCRARLDGMKNLSQFLVDVETEIASRVDFFQFSSVSVLEQFKIGNQDCVFNSAVVFQGIHDSTQPDILEELNNKVHFFSHP